MGWWWYLTPFGWIDAYMRASIWMHESGHLVAARIMGRTARRVPIESTGYSLVGRIEVFESRPSLCIALAGPLASLVCAAALWAVVVLIAAGGPPIGIRLWTVTALSYLALFEIMHGLGAVPREIRHVLKKS
ncbi:MAG TPA: hypothetical protein VMU12_02305 [Candidatus Paceibacterota bacterium]|nr:hypothetical protein [Candidatus Paceibacterota bacterium]